MNIYITKDNEDRLRAEESMSGLINKLLNDYYKDAGGSTVIKQKEDLVPVLSKMELCPHGYGKGNCKRDDCNRKYR